MLASHEYKVQVLEELANRFESNHNSLADAYALIWAIDVYASLVSFETLGKDKEPSFKNQLDEECEPFGIIRSASNALKHIERRDPRVVVKSMADITSGTDPSWHAWFSKGTSEPSIAITMNWTYDQPTEKYRDGSGEMMRAPENQWKTQYLLRLFRPAIDAIETKLPNKEERY
jgi:hypothetical protein